jgi:hypothetical protein
LGNNQKKIYPRIEIFDPASYLNSDSESIHLDQIIGAIQKISKNGIQIITFQEFQSEYVTLALVELENNKTEIQGKVISSFKQVTGIFRIGINFQGTANENVEFVKKISNIMPLIYQPKSIDNLANNKL